MKKYLFLDIDGVLNNYDWYEYRHDNPGNFNCKGLEWVKSEIDPECVKRVIRILESTGAELVISSNWRGDPDLKKKFELVGLPLEFDITPYVFIGDEHAIRGEEIKKYLDGHEPGNYAILDDGIDMREDQMDHFVNTDFMDGLTDRLADRVIEILNKEK